MSSVFFECGCGQSVTANILEEKITCPSCGKSWPASTENPFFEICPLCDCRQFYTQKDFNRALGCLVMLAGIILVPATYGLSLPFFAFFDWLLYRRVPTMIVCYKCGAEFRGFSLPAHLKEFLHPIGEKYERKKEKESKKG